MESLLDKCPGYNLYIGGFISLRRAKALKAANITHIVSVMDWQVEQDSPLIRGYQHLHIPVDDVEDENLLEWFPRSNAFIEQGLNHWRATSSPSREHQENADERGSGVLIHCAMGKSRSATVLLAFLLWATRHHTSQQSSSETTDMVPLPSKPLSVIQALELLRQGRPIAEPNEGFMDQLHMYELMGCPTGDAELRSHKRYRRWMNKRSVEESLRINQAPEMDRIKFEDEDEVEGEPDEDLGSFSKTSVTKRSRNDSDRMEEVLPGISAPDGTQQNKTSQFASPQAVQVTLKCRKCRHVLATTPFVLNHLPPPHRDPNIEIGTQEQEPGQGPLPPPQCAHVFLHPLSWMREVLSEGKMEGRLCCPNKKCGSNVGKFAWTGLRCSCGDWVTPGFGIIRGKIDENVSRPTHTGLVSEARSGGASSGHTMRLPPGMRKGSL